ncbi:MAG: dihydrodipicolinate synthase family protein [Janthinobacterium lividum]
MAAFNAATKGVYIIAATPFDDAGDLDLDSTDRLVEFYLGHGADGLTILGVMGEATRLSDEESLRFMRRVLQRVAGRVPVVVGTSHVSNRHVVRLSRQAMDDGASGIMIAPTPGLKTDESIYRYFETLLAQIGGAVPVCYQDFPQATGVETSVAVLDRLFRDFDQFVMFKHEACPGLRKLSQLRAQETGAAARRRVSILVGNNGMYIPQEMQRGADGMMTGFSYPELLTGIWRLLEAGRAEAAEDLYDCYLPLVKHEFQPGASLALRKELLRRRGAIRCAAVRQPGPVLDARDHLDLDHLVGRLERRLAALTL